MLTFGDGSKVRLPFSLTERTAQRELYPGMPAHAAPLAVLRQKLRIVTLFVSSAKTTACQRQKSRSQ